MTGAALKRRINETKRYMKLDINSFNPQKLRDFCKREGKKVVRIAKKSGEEIK